MAHLNTSRGWTTLELTLPTCARWTPMTRFFVLSMMTRNTSRSSSPMNDDPICRALSGEWMMACSRATISSRTSCLIRMTSMMADSSMMVCPLSDRKAVLRTNTVVRPVDGNAASVGRRCKGDRRESLKKMRRAHAGPGFRSQRAKSLALSQKRRKTGRRARHFFDVPCTDDQRARVRKQDARITNHEKMLFKRDKPGIK